MRAVGARSESQIESCASSSMKSTFGNSYSKSGKQQTVLDLVEGVATAPQPASTTRFKLFLPENGNVRFEVPEADIEPGTAVIFFNDTKRTSTSATIVACTSLPAASCFTASIAGSVTDSYFVELSISICFLGQAGGTGKWHANGLTSAFIAKWRRRGQRFRWPESRPLLIAAEQRMPSWTT